VPAISHGCRKSCASTSILAAWPSIAPLQRRHFQLPDLRGDGAVGDPVAGGYSSHVGDSGERRRAAQAAIDAAVPAEVLTKALCALRSR